MPGNIITIQFNEDLINTGQLVLGGLKTGFGLGDNDYFQYSWTWSTLRDASFKVTTGTPTITPGERSAINFATAFGLDVNGTNLYSVVRNGNVVVITGQSTTVNGITFDQAYAYKSTNPNVSVNVVFTYGQVNTSNFTLESLTYTQDGTNRCGFVRVNVKANQIITNVTSPVIVSPNADNFVFQYPRGNVGTLRMLNGQGIVITHGFRTPEILSANNYQVKINNSPNGATLITSLKGDTTANYRSILQLNYGIAQGNASPVYQTSNVFSGIAPGTYWMYIRDQFLCIVRISFVVDAVESTRVPVFFISKSMSIRFAKRVNFGDSANYKTDENTLSCEANVKMPYKEIQQFQSGDIITTQFKSNFKNNAAFVQKKDGINISVPVIKMSNNIGVKDKRDAIQVRLSTGKTGIYFQAGNTYDYDSGVQNGTHALNGNLPYWATFGNYFSLGNAWYKVDNIYYDENYSADVIVIDAVSPAMPQTVIVGSVFNLFNYEVYEFAIDMVSYNNSDINVKIVSSDTEFQTVTFLSEDINVKIKQENTVEIRYSNPENTDVFYSTGITNLIRQRLTKRSATPDQTIENNKTDTNTDLLTSEVYEVYQFRFEPVTTEIMWKMIQAFSHKNLEIDGVFYVANAPCEIEGPLEETNIYVVTANLIKADGAFNSNLSGSDNEIFDTTDIEIPGLLDLGDGNYIKY